VAYINTLAVIAVGQMRPMNKGLLTITLILTIVRLSCGQVKREQLDGDWETNNKDSLYYKSDTVEFIQDANWRYGIATCDIVILRVSKSEFKFVNTYLCSEPGTERTTNGKQTIRLFKQKSDQLIEIKILDKVEKFKVLTYEEKRVNRYPWDIKVLRLKRV
jgi:hypothetical protein